MAVSRYYRVGTHEPLGDLECRIAPVPEHRGAWVPLPKMNRDAHAQERIARQLLTQSPGLFVGVDGDGAAHYWDSYEAAVAVVPRNATDTTDATKHELADTPIDTLGQWCDHVRTQRGWATGPKVGGSLTDDLRRALA